MSQDSNQQHDDPTSSSVESGSPKIVFAPGCFDNFEGTQEELQELIAEIHRMAASGELLANSEPLDPDEMEYYAERKHEPRQ